MSARRLSALLLAAACAGCASTVAVVPATAAAPAPPPAAPPSAAAQLDAFFAWSDEQQLKLNPQSGLFRGDLRYAGDFGDLISDAWFAANRAQAEEELRRLAAIDRAALPPAQQMALDVFRYQTEYALKGYDTGVVAINQQLPVDHLFGQHIAFPQLSSGEGAAPYATVADYEAGLSRIGGFVIYLDRAQEQMRRGIAAGHVHIEVVARKVLEQLDEALAAGVDGSPLMKPVQNFPEAIPADQRPRLTAAYRAAVEQQVLPAFARLRASVARDYLPASRKGAPGLSSMPGGERLYAYALEQYTTTTMGAEEIHALGLAEVVRIEGEMRQVQKQVGFRGPLPRFFRHLRESPRFKFKDRVALLAGYAEVRGRVEKELPRLFHARPKSPLEIRPVPAEQESSAGGAYYVPGTPDGSRPGVFYVNASDLPNRTSPRMTALYLHEGEPGHHLQVSLTQENLALPAFLRFGYNTGYGEGWGLYCEWLGGEMGLYRDPYQYFGRLDMEMFRAIRLVVDTGLHARGWSRQQAIDYFLAHSSLDRKAVEQEVDRYIVWPGQATGYKVGELFIRRLRSRAEAALGPRFDVRDFHRQVLDSGALPLKVLEAKIDRWIAAGGG